MLLVDMFFAEVTHPCDVTLRAFLKVDTWVTAGHLPG